jgi:hypothetical protein
MPNGEPFDSFLAELAGLETTRVPNPVRVAVSREVDLDSRGEHSRQRVSDLLSRWSETPPAAVVLGTGKPQIQRMKTLNAEEPKKRAATPRAPRAEGTPAPKPARAAPVRVVDADRYQLLVDLCLERLSDYREHGLKEDVLVAGVRHRAKSDYPDVTVIEIMTVLRELQDGGRVRHSAGRWKRVLGAW